MTLQQIKILLAVLRNDCNISKAAKEVYLVQSALSRQLQLLESELGSQLFLRNGKRLVKATSVCHEVAAQGIVMLNAAANISNLASPSDETRELRVGTTHTQARYFLPKIVEKYRTTYPGVKLRFRQGEPSQLITMLYHDQVDISICSEQIGKDNGLVSHTCYSWNHVLLNRLDNPIRLKNKQLTLKQLAKMPLVTYMPQFTGGSTILKTFHQAGLEPQIMFAATDTDVIKTYLRLGLGYGIIIEKGVEEKDLNEFEVIQLKHLFPSSETKVGWVKGAIQGKHLTHFIDLLIQAKK